MSNVNDYTKWTEAASPASTRVATFTNERVAEVRFIKVDQNGYDRLNGGKFTLSKLTDATTGAVATDGDSNSITIGLESAYVQASDEAAGRDGRFKLDTSVTESIPAGWPIQFDEDADEIFFTETGTYRLTETKAPSGYKLPSEVDSQNKDYVDITVTTTGFTISGGNSSVASESALSQLNINEIDKANEYAVVIKDTPKTVYVQAQKVNESGTPITTDAATFSALRTHNATGTLDYWSLEGINTVATPEGQGKMPAAAIPYGTYTISETKAPAGYVPASDTQLKIEDVEGACVVTATGDDVYKANADDSGVTGAGTEQNPYVFKIINRIPSGVPVTLTKVDANTTTNKLGGAIFALASVAEGGSTTQLDTLKSGDDGILKGKEPLYSTGTLYLPAGTYTLTETEAPAGYNIMTSPLTLIVTEANGGASVTLTQPDSSGSQPQALVKTGDAYQGTITNNQGVTLPGTGGEGTIWLYALGASLVLASATALLLRRRARS